MVTAASPKKIIWLASYPKSGNTWLRAFLSALMNKGAMEINKMNDHYIFSSRYLFDEITGINSCDLYDDEVKNMQPDVFRTLARSATGHLLIKIHDAFSYNTNNNPIIPADVTHCAVYIIRNPLDIVASFANHNNITIDQAIYRMNNKMHAMAMQKDNHNTNINTRQLMYDWSGHVQSWGTLPSFPVYTIRYEDMIAAPFETFAHIIKQIGWEYSKEEIQDAVNATSFDKLKRQEKDSGFKERPLTSATFFRKGMAGAWKEELTDEQAKKITEAHASVMKKFNYL